ncbi:hypothetical protein DER46DRAFT_657756 [Fusarium sp. MPI-SDFR-AT-0072]|nr:hypothetical protein DER46DRAFT_657756 [Fusarium sp. MPI-SDFR-AT-0072]
MSTLPSAKQASIVSGFASPKAATDGYMPRLCPWDFMQIPCSGLCTHFAITETLIIDKHALPNDESAREDINRMEVERKKMKNRIYIANKGEGEHATRSQAQRNEALEELHWKCNVCIITFPFQQNR